MRTDCNCFNVLYFIDDFEFHKYSLTFIVEDNKYQVVIYMENCEAIPNVFTPFINFTGITKLITGYAGYSG